MHDSPSGAGAPFVVDAALAAALVALQFPHWSHLPVRAADPQGWDNRTFRLGDRLSVRLPSAAGYEPQIDKEHHWLPVLARRLPLPVPEPVALGRPALGYPFRWSVYRWRDGTVAADARWEPSVLAADLGGFLAALRDVPPDGGPPAGGHSLFRGGPLAHYAGEAVRALDRLPAGAAPGARDVLDRALASRWRRDPVWVHGDVAVNNLLVRDGRLAAVLDWGCSAVGDPACDTVPAWTMFDGAARRTFRAATALDADTWDRGRGWALWKAAITAADPGAAAAGRSAALATLAAVCRDATDDR
ncbi:aminoglycoside phosphotransferase family protein [Nakamurella endophytica]|uniref:aminoglycoside phosphotransferase family protein n=1 Tax=Nakamurella endophytica TaxID=1748367 RepID=UPI001E5013BD|nr:aminoglycoside phosphotransferase family protein [Nakamurella endophytica]